MDRSRLRDLIVSRCLRVFETDVADEAFAHYLGMSVAENLQVLTDLVCGRTEVSRLNLAQPLSFAIMQAQLHVPQPDLQRSYRVSFLTIWDEIAVALEKHGVDAGVTAEERGVAHHAITRAIFTYHDIITSRVAENYTKVESTLSQSRARLRQQLLREMLRNGSEPLPAADLALLEYDVQLNHLGVALHGGASDAAERLLRECRSRSLARDGLVLPRGLTSTIVWLGSVTPWEESQISIVCQVVEALGVTGVLSQGHLGQEGFVACVREVDEVMTLVQAHPMHYGAPVVRHSEVMLDVLLLRDPVLAADFVRRTLGALAEESPESARLCETVSTWLRHGSHVGAAEELGVHEQTIRNRLGRAEPLMGGGLRARRTEVEVALRLRHLLAGPRS